jgi:hypothetical protein
MKSGQGLAQLCFNKYLNLYTYRSDVSILYFLIEYRGVIISASAQELEYPNGGCKN